MSRNDPAGGSEHQPNNANSDDRLPAILRHHQSHPAGGARHRPRGWRGQLHRGAAGTAANPTFKVVKSWMRPFFTFKKTLSRHYTEQALTNSK